MKDYLNLIKEKFSFQENIIYPEEIKNSVIKYVYSCKKHGDVVKTSASELLRDRRKAICNFCIAYEQNLKKAKKLYNQFEYLTDNFENTNNNITFKCNKCGEISTQRLDYHLEGHGCPKCNSFKPWSLERLIKEGREKFGDRYDYSLIKEGEVHWGKKVKIKCNECGNISEVTPNNHLFEAGGGCCYCNGGRMFTTEEVKRKIIERYGNDRFDVSMVEYKGIFKNIKLVCKKCNTVINTTACNALNNIAGCRKCSQSVMEQFVDGYLSNKKISFLFWHEFEGLKFKRKLSYDFYLPDYNLLIECNGKQHYDKKCFGKTYKEFLEQKHKDWLKRKYAIKNNFAFLVIPYQKEHYIKDILDNIFDKGEYTDYERYNFDKLISLL